MSEDRDIGFEAPWEGFDKNMQSWRDQDCILWQQTLECALRHHGSGCQSKALAFLLENLDGWMKHRGFTVGARFTFQMEEERQARCLEMVEAAVIQELKRRKVW
jgi:hypothetical protein